ncbi:hypothetical protein J8273_2299 [Carpediemonas membranifera]|uniref:Uncharacterized protein n=1 Tax=Carpediemonas membranifera TaxID=201153 RepID=A0A8J6EB14_9EUKA|nr:hypothetical protein J8273_2299 [Carpediemonas membranifera]|eukprot:KAG9395950.1 hypothetical protein J8273_2299 [Carpediemonas membranifera]
MAFFWDPVEGAWDWIETTGYQPYSFFFMGFVVMLYFQEIFFSLCTLFLWELLQLVQLTLTGAELIFKNEGGWENHEPLGLTIVGTPVLFFLGSVLAMYVLTIFKIPYILPQNRIRAGQSEWSIIPQSLVKSPTKPDQREWNVALFLVLAYTIPGIMYFESSSMWTHIFVYALRFATVPLSFLAMWRRFGLSLPVVLGFHASLAAVVISVFALSAVGHYFDWYSYVITPLLFLLLGGVFTAVKGGAMVVKRI